MNDSDQNKDDTLLYGRFSKTSLESEGNKNENEVKENEIKGNEIKANPMSEPFFRESDSKQEADSESDPNTTDSYYFDIEPEERYQSRRSVNFGNEYPYGDGLAGRTSGGYYNGNRSVSRGRRFVSSGNGSDYRVNSQGNSYEKNGRSTYDSAQQTDQRQIMKAFLILGVCAIAALLIAFIVLLSAFVKLSTNQQGSAPVSSENRELKKIPGQPETAPYEGEADYNGSQLPGAGANGSESSNYGSYYGELSNSIRDDLGYGVEWGNYEFDEEIESVSIEVTYPIITGNMANLDLINDEILKEKSYFEELYKEYSVYMLEGEEFRASVEGYVTYMDEELMSIVFAEVVYTDYWSEYSLFCFNIDTQNGVILDNRNMIDVNTAFTTDFRIKSREQNGNDSLIDYMTEQELMYYLTDGTTVIVFYTPVGLEIGMNYGDGFLTVTYQDYEAYMKKY